MLQGNRVRRESLALPATRAVKVRRETLEVMERTDFPVLEDRWVSREFLETLEPRVRQGCLVSWGRKE